MLTPSRAPSGAREQGDPSRRRIELDAWSRRSGSRQAARLSLVRSAFGLAAGGVSAASPFAEPPFASSWAAAFNGQFWFAQLNGSAAVVLFFGLSGYVLTHRALATGDIGSLLRGMIKRWPRRAGPVLLTVVGA